MKLNTKAECDKSQAQHTWRQLLCLLSQPILLPGGIASIPNCAGFEMTPAL